MIRDRYYYSRLNDPEKEVYKAIYDGSRNFKKEIEIRCIPQQSLIGIKTAI